MADPRETLREIERVLQPREVGGQTVVPGYGPTRQPIVLDRETAQQPQYVGFGLYVDPSSNAYVKLNEFGEWVPASPAEVTALEKALSGAGGGDRITDPALYRLQQQATLQATLGEEQRAAEMHPLQMQQAQTAIETTEANLQRQILSDKFTVAQEQWNASYLAEQLAAAKRRDAANTLASLVDNLVPPGMTSLPGLPGSTMPTVATIDLSQFTQGLTPETDAALRYLMQTGQQTMTGLQGLGV